MLCEEDLASSHETLIPGRVTSGKPGQVREDRRDVRATDAEPFRQGGRVLIHRSSRDPAAGARVIWATNGQSGELPISLLTFDGTADDERMRAPSVVATQAVARESATEIAGGEGRDPINKARICVLGANRRHRPLERMDTLADFREKIRLRTDDDIGCRRRGVRRIGLIGVGVVPTHLDKKDLALHPQSRPTAAVSSLDNLGDHLQLLHQSRAKRAPSVRCDDLEVRRVILTPICALRTSSASGPIRRHLRASNRGT